jgi:hypothetical protein
MARLRGQVWASAVMTCAPRGLLAPPVWGWAHRMGGLKKLTSYLMAHSCDIYGRAEAPSALDSLGRFLFADEKRQDKQFCTQ